MDNTESKKSIATAISQLKQLKQLKTLFSIFFGEPFDEKNIVNGSEGKEKNRLFLHPKIFFTPFFSSRRQG
jgi:hypothetical protein